MKTIENILNNSLSISKIFLKEIVSSEDVVIDATLGNGYDALLLAELVGDKGKVYAFDIQEQAIERAKANIPENLKNRIEFIHDSHVNISDKVKEPVKLVLFNLGYLPNSDKDITTKVETTLEALKNSLSVLSEFGVVMLVIYRGHDEGKLEYEKIYEYISTLEQNRYNVTVSSFPNQKNEPPVLVCIQKR